ncbi:MAG: CHAD domain-containing protein [Betaproteobacteria bacterium]
MATETELKLAIAPEDMGRFAKCTALAAATRSKPVTRTVYSVYYDTPERDLVRRGMALRLRKVAGRWVQTLKTAGTAQAGLHQRGEFEAPAAAQLLNFVALSATPAAALFADAELRARLRPMFVTEFKRTARLVEIHPGELAELCVDRGSITGGANRAAISEIELELKAGAAEHLFDFADLLLAEVPLRLDNASKAERGYALLAPTDEAPAKARPPMVDAAMTASDAFVAIADACVRQLQANERGVVTSDDVEYIHQARVAIRRLRSAFDLFRWIVPKAGVAPLAAAVKDLGTAFGGARDWDVFLTETLPPIAEVFAEHPGIASIRTSAERLRATARAEARATVAAPRYTGLLLRLGATLVGRSWRAALNADALALEAVPIPEFATMLLERQWKRVRRAGKGHDDLAAEQLHALRIEIKKLRYAIEFLQALHPRKAVRTFLDQATELQDILGHLNDATVTAALLGQLPLADGDAREAAGLVRGWTAARSREGVARLDRAWAQFKAAKPYW